ncbi:hypothetical protein SH528x_000557 [Novipirellula sp. SH528]|uniref:hypothetical protein n=1 Tax=Novipirellula sp. SH528 TaxID=3454466 RepID=UPI003F9EE1CB
MRTILSLSAVALLLASVSIASAQDAAADKSKLETTPTKRTPANQIDFNAELQVPLQALSHLGKTIEEAREEADPICIASAANILGVAESLAGDKKASLTSAQLWDEAIQLAERRKSSAELAALAKMAPSDKAASLQEQSSAAKEAEDEAAAAAIAGEATRDLHGDMHVMNRSHEYIYLYVDGRYIGSIAPHQQREFHLHGAYHLLGRSHYHTWHQDIHGHRHHYDWVLHDPHHPH